MFQDEARFGRISDTRYCWCRRPARPLVHAMVTQQYTYAYGAVSLQDGAFDSLVLPHVNFDCMQIFLDEIASRYPNDNVVMVLDGAGWHKCKDFRLPDNLRLLFLPPYSPELNPQEHLWDELREKHFTIASLTASMPSKTTSSWRYAISKTLLTGSKALPLGTGLLMLFLLRNRNRRGWHARASVKANNQPASTLRA